MLKTARYLITTMLAAALPFAAASAQPVIPGAVGFGIHTPAGRGGRIIPVTNLNATGAGSLRACVNASGPRICVFEVSGTIRLTTNLAISNPYITIAGQTAPAPGIMIRGAGIVVKTSDVLIQHLAVRAGDGLDGPTLLHRDSLKVLGTDGPVRNVVIDHCSLSWAVDEVAEVWGSNWDNVTFSNNIFSEPLREAPEEAGKDQGYGILVDATKGRVSFIGNLFAHIHNRTPRSAAEGFVFVNNLVYNAGIIQLNLYNEGGLATRNAVVGNVFIKGRDTTAPKPILINGDGINGIQSSILSGTTVFLADNWADEGSSDDPWSIVKNDSDLSLSVLKVLEAPIWLTNLTDVLSSQEGVVERVLKNAGAHPAERSGVDARIAADVRNGTGRIINCVADDGSIRCAKNAGGWPKLASNTRRLSLPANPDGDSDGDGYTNAEEWLHAFAAQVEGRAGSAEDPTPVQQPSPPKPPHLANAQ